MPDAVNQSTAVAPRSKSAFEHVMLARQTLTDRDAAAAETDMLKGGARQAILSGTSHLWSYWLAPSGSGSAMLVNGSWNLSAFALCGWYRSVLVLEFDQLRADCFTFAAEMLNLPIKVVVIDKTNAQRQVLGHAAAGHELIALQDIFDEPEWFRPRDRKALVDGLARAIASSGQLAIVNGGRYHLSAARLKRFRGRPTPQSWRRTSTMFAHARADWLYFHPDHQAATELIQGERPLPASRRSDWRARMLSRLGAIETMLGAYAVITRNHGSRRLIDQWTHDETPDPETDALLHNVEVRGQDTLFVKSQRRAGERWMLRIPLNRASLEALQRADAAVLVVRSMPFLGDLVPPRLPVDSTSGWPVSREMLCDGVPARRFIERQDNRTAVRRQVESIVDAFATETMRHVEVDRAIFLQHWGHRLDALISTHPDLNDDLSRMGAGLWHQLKGKKVTLVRIHGDLTPNNLFVDPETQVARGLIDWETSLPDSLPFDCIHYLVNEVREREDEHWGRCVARFMTGDGMDDDAQAMVKRSLEKLRVDVDLFRPLLAGYWIRGVALRQSLSGGTLHPGWSEANFLMPMQVMIKLGAS